MATFTVALREYESRTGVLPTNAQGLEALVEPPTIEPRPEKWVKIMESVPLDRWGRRYVYETPGTHQLPVGYDLYSVGPDGKAGTRDDVGNWKQ